MVRRAASNNELIKKKYRDRDRGRHRKKKTETERGRYRKRQRLKETWTEKDRDWKSYRNNETDNKIKTEKIVKKWKGQERDREKRNRE